MPAGPSAAVPSRRGELEPEENIAAMSPISSVLPTEPTGWAERVTRARASVHGAKSLDELAEVLNSSDFAALPLKDLVTLPTFGGERPRGRCVFSWDTTRVLMMNDLGDGFTIEPRGTGAP
jgi:hypothetical protein